MKKLLACLLAATLPAGTIGSAGQAGPDKSAAQAPGVRSVGKATAPVALRYRLDGKPAVGEPVALQVTLVAREGISIAATASADDALGLAAASRHEFAGRGTVTLPLMPLAEGRFYVDIVAVLGQPDGASIPRVFTIPVQVGQGAPAPGGKLSSRTPGGELLVRMQSRPHSD